MNNYYVKRRFYCEDRNMGDQGKRLHEEMAKKYNTKIQQQTNGKQ